MIYALIKDGVVVNSIVSGEDFNLVIANDYDAIVNIDELEVKPDIGWEYDGETFAAPVVEEPPVGGEGEAP